MTTLSAWVLAGSLAGCGGSAVPRTTASIRTDHDRYVLRPGRFGDEATIVATFTAPRDTTVHVLNCNGAFTWGIQRLEAGVWRDAWIVATNGCFSTPLVVMAGASRTDTLHLVSRTPDREGAGPHEEIAPGTYRVAWYNVVTAYDSTTRSIGPELPLERRVSAPITIDIRR